MEIKDEKKSFLISILGIVGIVAIVGIVVMLTQKGGGGIAVSSEDIAGEATSLSTTACTDYDNGKNIYVQGGTIGYRAPRYGAFTKKFSQNDYCAGMDGNLLTEYYCGTGVYIGVVRASNYKCKYGCKDGACLKTPPAQNIPPAVNIPMTYGIATVTSDERNEYSNSRTIPAGKPFLVTMLLSYETTVNGKLIRPISVKYGYNINYALKDPKGNTIRTGKFNSGIWGEDKLYDTSVQDPKYIKFYDGYYKFSTPGEYTFEFEIFCSNNELSNKDWASNTGNQCGKNFGLGTRVGKQTEKIQIQGY